MPRGRGLDPILIAALNIIIFNCCFYHKEFTKWWIMEVCCTMGSLRSSLGRLTRILSGPIFHMIYIACHLSRLLDNLSRCKSHSCFCICSTKLKHQRSCSSTFHSFWGAGNCQTSGSYWLIEANLWSFPFRFLWWNSSLAYWHCKEKECQKQQIHHPQEYCCCQDHQLFHWCRDICSAILMQVRRYSK